MKLFSDSATGTELASFTKPTGDNANGYDEYTPTSTVTLRANNTYWVVLEGGQAGNWTMVGSAEDSGRASGWTIANNAQTRSSSSTGSFANESSGNVRSMRINGKIRPNSALPALVSAVVDGSELTLTYDEDLKTVSPVSAAGKGPVYQALVSAHGVRRTRSIARVTGVAASGRVGVADAGPAGGVPPVGDALLRAGECDGGEPGAGRGRQRGGGLRAGAAGAERHAGGPACHGGRVCGRGRDIRDRRRGSGMDVIFSEPVTVTGTPTLELEVGAGTREAAWKAGQAAGAVQRFEYIVAEGDEDTDGVSVAANGLEAPSGSTIRAKSEDVILRHGSFVGAAHLVDGVRPTASSAQSEGPSVNLVWSEQLDGVSVPTGAGGFTVAIAGGTDPVVTAVAVSGSVVTLSLNAPIGLGTQGVTADYTPGAVPIRDAAGNAAVAFADPLAVTVAQDNTAPVLTAAAVEGDRLTLTYNEPLKVTSPAKSGAGVIFAVGVSGGSAFTLSDIRAGVGAGNRQVTMTLAPAAEAGQTVTAAYTAANATAATRVQDLAGNEAVSFTATTALTPSVTLRNDTGTPTLTLSTAQVTEGDDAEVVLTISSGGTAYSEDRTITISVESGGTAEVSEDWTLSSTSVALLAGTREATAVLTILDDARLEGTETVRFKASLGAVETPAAELTIADDDRVVLAVTGPDGPATEGEAIDLELRLEPHPDNLVDVSTVPDDACLVDFPVTAVLTRAGDTASALPNGAVLETEHAFPATAFDACTREVAVSVPTRAADGSWSAPRALSLTLAPKGGSDARIEAGQALAVTVRDSTPGGPLVTAIAISPVPPEASANYEPTPTQEAFEAVRAGKVHGPDTELTFTLTFDHGVTVTPDAGSGARPELALDIFGRARRAAYTGPVGTPTLTLTFSWTVKRGDYDPDGLEVRGIVLNGATILDGGGRAMPPGAFPAGRFARHRVRGGFFTMRMEVAGPAREGEPVRVTVVRDGGSDERAIAAVHVRDSGNIKGPKARLLGVSLEPEGSANDRDGDWRRGSNLLVVPGDGEAGAGRTLTVRLSLTETGGSNPGGALPAWYDPAGPLRVVLPVADTGLAKDAPELSVSWAIADEGSGADLVFEVRLKPEAAGEVRVDYATRDGNATAGLDYTATRGTLTFLPGEVRKEVSVAVLADSHDEGSENMALVLSNPRGAVIVRGEGIGTIRNRDPLQKSWLGRFGRTVAEQVLEAVESRMQAAPAPGLEVTLAGERVVSAAGSGEEIARGTEAGQMAVARWIRGEPRGSWSPRIGARIRQSGGGLVAPGPRRVGARTSDGLLLRGLGGEVRRRAGRVLGPGRDRRLRRSRGHARTRRRGDQLHARRRLDGRARPGRWAAGRGPGQAPGRPG